MAIGRRVSVLAGVMATAVALILPASPASAQAGGPGAQATPVVGVSGTANCPTNVVGNQVTYIGPAGPLNITQSGGSCSSFSANTQGSFTANGATGDFSSSCQAGPPPTASSAVTVPIGTSINGGPPVAVPTVVTMANTPVVFPGGTAATLNVQTLSGNTVTQTAIVLAGGPQIGRVVCGAANVYPLAVDVASASPAPPALPVSTSGGSSGMATGAIVALAALALVAAQLAFGRKMWHRKGDVTG